jgi:hypothetical protein
LNRPAAECIQPFAPAQQKAQYKMIGGDFSGPALYKSAFNANPVYNRFTKKLIKVFFTLVAEMQFVDIVKCV